MQQVAATATQTEYLRLRDAAPFLGISSAHLQNLLRRGEAPPSTRLGRARLFSVETLRAFMREREQ